MMTQAQIQALATFISRVREDWDHPGIVAAISKASGLGSPFDVARALVNLAENRDLTSPGMLSQPGRHWVKASNEPTGPNLSNNVRCPEHPINFMPCPLCEAKRCLPDPVEHADYIAAREALKARRPIPTEQKRLADFTPGGES